VLVAIASVAAVRPLREQARGSETAQAIYEKLTAYRCRQGRRDPLDPFRQRAVAFVERHYPTDAEMLMAAGLLALQAEQGMPALQRARQSGRRPVFYAAYTSRLVQMAPRLRRPAGAVIRAGLPEGDAALQRARSAPGVPGRQELEATASILSALHQWEAADPDNGLPHALEFYYLYGIYRDQEAEHAWERAARLPRAQDYAWAMNVACAWLLHRMGMVEADATVLSFRLHSRWVLDGLRLAARAARALQGRPGSCSTRQRPPEVSVRQPLRLCWQTCSRRLA